MNKEKKEIEDKIEQELRITLGYSGGASDSDILTCETFGGRTSSQRFDVFLKGIMPELMKLMDSHANKKLEEVREKVGEILEESMADLADSGVYGKFPYRDKLLIMKNRVLSILSNK